MEIVLVVMVVLSFALVGWLSFAQAGEPPPPGKPAPDFRLPGTEGEEHSLQSLRGRRAVLVFHPQDETPECLAVVERLAAAAAEIEAAGASLCVIVVSSGEKAASYASAHGPGLRVLCDVRGRTAKAYGALVNLGFMRFARKLVVLVDAHGRVERIWRDAVGPHQIDDLLRALATAPR